MVSGFESLSPSQTRAWRPLHLFLAALAFAPAIPLAGLVNRYGVDVLYRDQWEEVPFMAKAFRGGLTLADFFEPHNEHRIFFPRLLFVLLARLTHWNVRAEMGLIVAGACLIAWSLQILLRRSWPEQPVKALAFSLVVNLFVFSPIQHQNWLWGFQLQFLAPILCFSALLALPERLSPRIWAALAAALCVVSTFSLGAGFLVWVAALPVLLARLPRPSWLRAALLWLLGLAACLTLYLYGYVPPRHTFSNPPFFEQPALFARLFVTMLGQPLAIAFGKARETLAFSLGALLLLAYAALLAQLVRARSLRTPLATVAWASLGLHALLLDGLITFGRAGAGIGSAFASRYTTPTLYLVIAVFVLAILTAEDALRGSASPLARLAFPTLASLAVLIWSVPSGRIGRDDMEARFVRLSQAKAELVLSPLLPRMPLSTRLHPDPARVAEGVQTLDALGLLRPPLRKSARVADVATLRPGTCGALEEVYPDRRKIRVLGAAWLPDRPRVPDAVLITYHKGQRGPIVFAAAGPGRSRPDVAQALHCPACLDSGWEAAVGLPDTLLPARIEAWAYDVEANTLCRLEGDYRLER